MNQVHAPYHFVPLSQWVYSPEWAHLVSHDHPFREGLSGTLHYELTNQTPLLVGGDQEHNANQPARIKWSCDPDGKPVIPGTSLKGMIRNVLEIATFAKFRQVDDSRYGYRDFSNAKSKYLTTLSKKNVDTTAGWLSFDPTSKSWFICKAQHVKLFTSDSKKTINNKFNHELTAIDKYNYWNTTGRQEIFFDVAEKVTPKSRYFYATNVEIDQKKTSKRGYPIFTSNRPGKDDSLKFDYIFYDVDDSKQPCDSRVVQQMFAAHKNEKCDIGKYLEQHQNHKYGIPVFVHRDKKNNSIVAMGFTKMPKLLYEKSTNELILKPHNATALFDFPELLFGTQSHSGFALKSRVSFADARCLADKGRQLSEPVILAQPKASYLGAYLEQVADAHGNACDNNLSQYDKNSRLSGWKRYPAQTGFSYKMQDELRSKVNVQSQLELMEPKSRFAGKIVFHNLKAEELGALIWTLCPDEKQMGRFHHSLGHGKSLGAGAVQFCNLHLTLRHPTEVLPTIDSLRSGFVEHMNRIYPVATKTPDGWSNSPQIRHLLAFGDRVDNDGKNLRYMSLGDYTASMKNLKKVLPAWKHQGEQLSRTEQIAPLTVVSGLGRLHDLLQTLESEGKLPSWEKKQHEQAKAEADNAAVQAAKEAVQAKEEEFRRSLSELGLRLYDLRAELAVRENRTDTDSQNFRSGRAPTIDDLLRQYLSTIPQPEQREAQMLYELATDNKISGYFNANVKPKDLSKKQKERHMERMQLLTALVEKFALKHGEL